MSAPEPALPSRFGPSVEPAFQVASAELGMCSAAWLFVAETAAEGGDAMCAALRDALGRAYPVLDAVAAAWLSGARKPRVNPAGVLEACAGATQLLIVGIESLFLDALVPRLPPDLAPALLMEGRAGIDWTRVTANYGRMSTVDMSSFQRLAGRRSALLTFLYGVQGESTWVEPTWLRVIGPDVRTQFRTIIGWDVLGGVMYVYPRWMVEASVHDFSSVVGG